MSAASTLKLDPNGPNSTSGPAARTASTAASTCGPGCPATNGSTVNVTSNTRHRIRAGLPAHHRAQVGGSAHAVAAGGVERRVELGERAPERSVPIALEAITGGPGPGRVGQGAGHRCDHG